MRNYICDDKISFFLHGSAESLCDVMKIVNPLSVEGKREQIKFIHAAGYATDPKYAEKIIKVISQNNLTQYDNVEFNSTTRLSNEEIAKKVIRGEDGNGAARRAKLTREGYNYKVIQSIVNEMLK